jgi:phosphoglycerate kinase
MIEGIKTIEDLGEIKGKRVLVRLDLNVPIKQGAIRDPFRIDAAIPSVNLLRKKGAKVIVISHIGKDASSTLRPVSEYLASRFPVTFLPRLDDPRNTEVIARMKDGEVALLENLRSHEGEESNDPAFAKLLASYADLFVSDAFSVAHRKHASVVGVPKLLPSAMGLQFQKEIENLSQALRPEHPFLFILGGAKIATKLPLLKKFLPLADTVFVGGALANTLLFAQGHPVGASVYDKDAGSLDDVKAFSTLHTPDDVVVRRKGKAHTVSNQHVGHADTIVDVGSGSIKAMEATIARSKLIVWNGPLGWYEEGFTQGTEALLKVIASSKAVSIIGGGDTVALISALKMEDQFTFVSTGGGAMLDYLANETLPGLEALKHT